jgi:hypothetical protein
MKQIVMGAFVCLLALGSAVTGSATGSSCKDQATAKKLAGAALTSFMGKCQKDATASCDATAQSKKLAGAAKTSFVNKCVRDAVGS